MINFSITGLINSKGEPMFSGIDRWKAFFAEYPDRAFICEISVHEPYKEDHIIWYYVKVVLPAIRDRLTELGDIKSLKEIDEDFRTKTDLLYNSKISNYKRLFNFEKWEPVYECTREELILYIETINKHCAEYLSLIISKEI